MFLALYLYVTFSWWCYYYMNGFGARPMIHVYPLLAFPLALLLERVWAFKKSLRLVLVLFSAAAVALSIGFQMQQSRGNLFSEQSNAGFALTTAFKRGLCSPDLVRADLAIAQPDPASVQQVEVMVVESLATPLDHALEFFPVPVQTEWSDTIQNKMLWFRCSGRFMAPDAHTDFYTQPLLTLQTRKAGDDKPQAWYGCRISNKLGWSGDSGKCRATLFSGKTGVWDEVAFFVPVPDGMPSGTILEVGVWNRGKQPLLVSELRLELWAKR